MLKSVKIAPLKMFYRNKTIKSYLNIFYRDMFGNVAVYSVKFYTFVFFLYQLLLKFSLFKLWFIWYFETVIKIYVNSKATQKLYFLSRLWFWKTDICYFRSLVCFIILTLVKLPFRGFSAIFLYCLHLTFDFLGNDFISYDEISAACHDIIFKNKNFDKLDSRYNACR